MRKGVFRSWLWARIAPEKQLIYRKNRGKYYSFYGIFAIDRRHLRVYNVAVKARKVQKRGVK